MLADLPPDHCVAVGTGEAVVARLGEEVVAFQNRCLHQSSPLAGGRVADGKLTCPLHFWRYRLPSGEHLGREGSLPSYPVTVEQGEVFVEVPGPKPALPFREMMLQHAREWKGRGITTVVWDMGGIFQIYFTELLVDVGRARGWPLWRMPMGPTGEIEDLAYEAMTRGDISEPEYLKGILASLRSEGIVFDPVTDPDWEAERRPEVWKLIQELAVSDLSQAILTNDATRWLGESWWETWPDRHLFDAIVDVATLAERKPAPEPFLAVLDRLGVDPGVCVFVDDMAANCRGAEAVGMDSVWFDITAPSESIGRLRERIGRT